MAEANGHAKRDMTEKLLRHFRRQHGVNPETVSVDRANDAGVFLRSPEEDLSNTPRAAIPAQRVTCQGPAADAGQRMLQRMKTKSYAPGRRARKKTEQLFGWIKQPGELRKMRHVGCWKIQQVAYLGVPANNLLRLAHLEVAA